MAFTRMLDDFSVRDWIALAEIETHAIASDPHGRRFRNALFTDNIRWQASGVASGVYFYRLTTGRETITRKMVLLR